MRIAFAILFSTLGLCVASQDTLRFRAHDRAIIVTDPARGVRSYPVKLRLPAREQPVRKALLTLTLGCPDGMRCADWDYLDHVLLRSLSAPDTFELTRVLTPYGGTFTREWRHGWQADVTDFMPVLRDSVELIYVHSGYEPNEDRGWALTLELALITGPPAAEVLSVTELYRGHFKYGSKDRGIEEDLKPRAIQTDRRAELLRVRIQQTGHGMHADDGCGEFCAKWRSVKVDGKEVSKRKLWKECASNPIAPQAGTWTFDRANWCPGELQRAEEFTTSIKSGGRPLDKHTVDIDMEPYAHDSSDARTDIAAYAVQLARPRAKSDVAIEAILIPNDDPRYARLNPAVHEPRVVVRNMGSSPMDMVLIEYGTEGFPKRRYVHGKRVRFGECDTVQLPHLIDMRPGLNTFTVTVSKPGGRNDKWKHDNVMRSTFTAADVLDSVLIVQLRTNAEPQHNAFGIANTRGHAFLSRPLGSLKPDTLYTDTLRLPSASYVLQLSDTAGDGLEYWYNGKGGRGFLRLLDAQGRLLKRFESDCGNGIDYQFRVSAATTLQPDARPDIGLFPSRTSGATHLDYFANDAGTVTLELHDEGGAVVWNEVLGEPLRQFQRALDFSLQPRGRYQLKVLRDGTEVFSRRMRLVDRVD